MSAEPPRKRLGFAQALLGCTFAALFAACAPTRAYSAIPPGAGVEETLAHASHARSASPKDGLYVGQFYDTVVQGYASDNRSNKPPICQVPGVYYVNGLAVDGKGNLVAPDGQSDDVLVFKGPQMCGSQLTSIPDSYGTPSDAASADAANGLIVVANEFDGALSKPTAGSLTLCSVAAGCTTNLTNPKMYEVGGVALAPNGDCWASALPPPSSYGTPELIYFKRCAGDGVVAKHYKNTAFGGLEIDGQGNILSIGEDARLYVYRGCNPSCAVVGGPFKLRCCGFFGKLNHEGTLLALGNFSYEDVDIYRYTPSKVTYTFSFDNGLGGSLNVEGVAFNPRSKE